MPNLSPRTILDGMAGYAFIDDVSVVVTRVPRWTDELVVRYLVEMTSLANRAQGEAAVMEFLGDVLGPHHRKLTLDWLAKAGLRGDSRACILTESALMRGAMTAYAWLSKSEATAFAPREIAAAAAWATKGLRANPALVVAAYHECRALVDPQARAAR